jgi:thiol-disulfide isomerase/thioredoxin
MNFKITFFLFILLTSGYTHSKQYKLKAGDWYTTLILSDTDQLPFILKIEKQKKLTHLYIINGSEKILLDKVQNSKDSVFISFPAFDSEFRFKVHNSKHISGNWYNHAKKGNYYIPFWSKHNYATRYPLSDPSINIDGRWEVTFDYLSEPDKAIGIFNQSIKSNIVEGTFLTETGDYRYLEGAIIKDSLYLTTFDGSHAFLFKSILTKDTLWGTFLSGNHYKTEWYAVKNNSFELGHPDSLTYLINNKPVSFSLTGLDKKQYEYPNNQTKDKVTLIQIMGTWCPNCLDESLYLKELYNSNKEHLEIIAVTFETQKTLDKKIERVTSYKTNAELDYTFVIGGDACKPCANDLFPMLNDVISFPTLIFLDKKGQIRKIHTGFNGPGTGEYYSKFVAATNKFVQSLIEE